MYHHSNDFRERNRYRKTSSYTTEGFRSRNLSYTPTRTSHQYTTDIRPQPHKLIQTLNENKYEMIIFLRTFALPEPISTTRTVITERDPIPVKEK